VDLEDDTYLVPAFSHPDLTESVRHIGILNPPLIQESEDGRLIPVLGRRRLRAARAAAISRVKVGVISSGMPVADGFRFAFWDNIHHRRMDPATTAVLVKKLLDVFPRKTAAEEFLPALGLRTSGFRLERLRRIGELESALLERLAEGRILEKTAAILVELTSEERRELVQFTERLGLNANKKAEVIGHLFDLSILRSRPVLEFLRDDAALAIMESDIPIPEQASRFRNHVRSLTFPELVHREVQFNHWLRSLKLPHEISLSPAPAFETGGCTIEIRADSLDEAERIVAKITHA